MSALCDFLTHWLRVSYYFLLGCSFYFLLEHLLISWTSRHILEMRLLLLWKLDFIGHEIPCSINLLYHGLSSFELNLKLNTYCHIYSAMMRLLEYLWSYAEFQIILSFKNMTMQKSHHSLFIILKFKVD